MEAPSKKVAERNLCSVMSNIPRHVLMEILCRLPIKTLLSCKSVCKLWLNLISADSDFTKLHLQRSPSELLFHSSGNSGVPTRFYMGNIQFDDNTSSNLKLSPLFDFPMFNVTRSNFIDYSDTRNGSIQFTNSCNGLVCFHYDSENQFAVICNPIMGDFVTIPTDGSGEYKLELVAYGLGFSGKANRYKLLHIMQPSRCSRPNIEVSKQSAEIYTFEKGSSWRNVVEFPYLFSTIPWSTPVFLEGKLHIHCLLSYSPYRTALSCFDFDNERFEEVPFPPGDISWETIGILGGCLFGSHFRHDSNSCDIWVMKEYGVKDSWTKAFSIAKYDPDRSLFERHKPIQHLDIGEILMLHQHRHLVSHNPNIKCFRFVGDIDNLTVYAYSPTLLLLKDALMGYDASVCNVNLRYAYLEEEKLATIRYWESVEKNYVQKSPRQQGSKAPLTNGFAGAGEERNGHVSPTSEFSVRESSKALLGHEQGINALTNDKIHVPITGEERHGPVCGTGLVQTPASSSATQATTEVLWGKMKSLVDNLGEELRKERQQRQELEQRLQNEVAKVEPLKDQTEHLKQQNQQLEQTQQRLQNEIAKIEPLKEQTEHLKQQNQQLEQSLRNEQAKVEQLKEQIQQTEQFKQQNQKMMLEIMDEMRAQLGGSQ